MAYYEMTFALRSAWSEEERAELLERLKSFLGERNAELVNVEETGIRRLGYQVDGEKDAYFAIAYLDAEPSSVAACQKFMKTQGVLRLMTVKRKTPPPVPSEEEDSHGSAE